MPVFRDVDFERPTRQVRAGVFSHGAAKEREVPDRASTSHIFAAAVGPNVGVVARGVFAPTDSFSDGTPRGDSNGNDGLNDESRSLARAQSGSTGFSYQSRVARAGVLSSPDARDAEARPDAGVHDDFHCPDPYTTTERWYEDCTYSDGGYLLDGRKECTRKSYHEFSNPHPAYDLSTNRWFTVCDQSSSTDPATCGDCRGSHYSPPPPTLPSEPSEGPSVPNA
jgi:hypothetical protein